MNNNSELSGLPLEEIKILKIAIERLWEQDRKLHCENRQSK
jgi:hypothetical protein